MRANRCAVLIPLCLGTPIALAHGGELGSVLEPDVFGTETALQRRTVGLSEQNSRTCETESATLTLSAAVELALCLNPATRSAWAAAHQQAAALGGAQSAWLPQVSATGEESRYYGEHVDVTGLEDSRPQNSRDAALSLSWTVYDFGGRDGRISSARHLLDAAAATVSSTAQQTILTVVQSYYGVVAGDAGVEAATTAENASARSLEVARTLSQGGAGTLADVLQAETAYDQSVMARIQAEATAKTAHGSFAVALGLPADRTFTLTPDPVPLQAPTLNARMASLMAEAVRQRPDLAAAEADRESAASQVRVARAAGLPTVSITANRSIVDTTGLPNENYSLAGLNVTIPIFTGFSVAYGVRQAKAQLESAEANVDQVKLAVSLSVWNSYHSLNYANQQLSITAGLTKTADQNQEVSLGRYQAGVGTIVDVLTAQSAATLARQTRISTEYSWQVARAQLALALGRLTGAEPLRQLESSLP